MLLILESVLFTRWKISQGVITVCKAGQWVQPASIFPTRLTMAVFVLLNNPFYFGRHFLPSFLTARFPYRTHHELTIAKWRGVAGRINTFVAIQSLPVPGFVLEPVILILSKLTALPADPAWSPLLP